MTEVTDIAPGVKTKEESDEQEHTWKILIYGNPGTGKTHFTMTMPEPVCLIDTEGKAHDITSKFDKDIFIWDVDNYDESKKALGEALDVLESALTGELDGHDEGTKGTIAVDSMSLMWEWAQQKYVSMAYPGEDPDDVEFQSALQGGGNSDWKAIKQLHNESFREPMVKSGFHLCWTARSDEDYGAVLSGDADEPPMKPRGEKGNIYKSTELLHVFEGDKGIPMGNLKRSGLTKLKFGRMPWPTFEKVHDMVRIMEEAETSDDTFDLDKMEEQHGVDLFTGDPDVIYRESE